MLYIRVDMNNQIATGHVMRCLAIADASKMLGEDVSFILADNQASGFIKERGYQTIILHSMWNDMITELKKLIEIIQERKITKLLIDSYQVTAQYLETLKKYTKIIYIDDLHAFQYPANAIICYANYWEKFHYEKFYKDTKLYLGMQYVPLQKPFSHSTRKIIKRDVGSILLLSGGTDPYHVLKNILNEIHLENYKQINVICGFFYPEYEDLCKKHKNNKNVQIYQNVSNIVHFMKEADLAVSAGGTTLYELCAIGTPTISYSFADNQLDNVKKFDEDGLIPYAGDLRKDPVIKHVIDYLESYRHNWKYRREISLHMQELVDGKGAMRIAKALMDE